MGENIAGQGVILGAQYVRDFDAFVTKNAAQYSRTPTFPIDEIPRGSRRHLGGGIWLARCRECDNYVLTYGTAWCYEFGKHERDHGLDVVGINVAILP